MERKPIYKLNEGEDGYTLQKAIFHKDNVFYLDKDAGCAKSHSENLVPIKREDGHYIIDLRQIGKDKKSKKEITDLFDNEIDYPLGLTPQLAATTLRI